MLLKRQVNCFTFSSLGLTGLLLVLFASCVTPGKNYPRGKPFVFKTNINVKGNFSASERLELISSLENQLDDSLKTRVISYAGVYKKLIKPPVFDTINIFRSRIFMSALLNARGYFYPTIRDTFFIDTVKKQLRTTINFYVTTGRLTRLDSVGFDLLTPELQSLALRTKERTLLKKGEAYSLQNISDERDRLLRIFHDSGYYKVSGNDIYAEVDTVIAALIDPSIDPFEQIRLLDSLRRKNLNPTINVVFKQREANDPTHLKQFRMGTIKVYPDQFYLQDSIIDYKVDSLKNPPITFYTTSNRFKLPFLSRNIFLKQDSVYRERNYFRTVNTFNRLGAWQNVDLTLKERYNDTVPRLDAEIRLFPAPKLNLKIDLEASRNVADYLTTSQLFGLGVNFSVTNRNAFHEAIQSSTNARFGVEFGSNFIQTLQTNVSHSIYFPRLIIPFKLNERSEDRLLNVRTVFNINGAYTIRKDIYNVNSINSSWGYEWTVRKGRDRSISWLLTIPNVEYTLLRGKDSLNKLIQQIPSLRYAFNDGFVIGIIGGMNTSWRKKNRTTNLKLRVEESGALFGFIRDLERNNLFRYVKTDIELVNQQLDYNGWAFRAFAGYGYVYGKKGDQPENKLPFFKAYFAGGPYSMRAWQVRRLGPGSTPLYDTASNRSNDRFGNMRLEGNIEYRFNVTTIAGVKVKSAVFLDIGNVWGPEFRDAAGTQKIPEASFDFGRLYKDIAIGGGTSLRFDFDFFLIRLDWAYKLKNPRYASINNGWFYDLKLFDGQFQLGIGYPF